MKETINPVTASKLKPWVPTEDLPANWEGIRHPELPVLSALWKERRSKMEDLDVVNEFHARRVRQWAIETGILERLYDIDRGTTIVLIERGIDATLIPHGATDRATSEVVSLLKDHVEVAEGLFQFVANKQALTNFHVRQLHQVLTRHQRTCSAIDTLGNAAEPGTWRSSAAAVSIWAPRSPSSFENRDTVSDQPGAWEMMGSSACPASATSRAEQAARPYLLH
jgi:hypothetical protein